MSAGDKRTSRVEINANEAGNQRLTPKRTEEGPSLDKRLAVAESQFGYICTMSLQSRLSPQTGALTGLYMCWWVGSPVWSAAALHQLCICRGEGAFGLGLLSL